MMNIFRTITGALELCFGIGLLMLGVSHAWAQAPGEAKVPEQAPACRGNPKVLNPPFAPGEKLTYKLVWCKIRVGYLTVEVKPMVVENGKPAWHFSMRIKTNKFADNIYKVRQYADSVTALDLSKSYRYRTQSRQGKSKRIRELEYHWDKLKVHYVKNGKDRGMRDLKPNCVDPLAMFYVLRTKELKDKKEIIVRVADAKTCIDSKARIRQRKRLKICGKKRRTVLIEPELKGLRGVFKRSKNAKLQLWITEDESRVPVKVASKVVVGKFYAILIKHDKPPKKAAAAE